MNPFIKNFINSALIPFRAINSERLTICIEGLYYNDNDDMAVVQLQELLSCYNIILVMTRITDRMECLNVSYSVDNKQTQNFSTNLIGLTSLINLSAITDLSLAELIIIKFVGQVLNRIKVIYKAIVLDLDDTLWKGTLSEIGKEDIKKQLLSPEGHKHIAFMKFMKRIADELGIFLAICSKNNIEDVEDTIRYLPPEIFPLKDQLDVIIANDNNKSDNIIRIASELSILPNSIIFIDDNAIVRSEVRQSLPDCFIPEWNDIDEIYLLLETAAIFERPNISKNSQNRRKQYRVIQAEKQQSFLPQLYCRIYDDPSHTNAIELYGKSNQFNWSQFNRGFADDIQSVYLTIHTPNKDDLGICSSFSYRNSGDIVEIQNWAISCRFFEIGLEEYLLLHMIEKFKCNKLTFRYNDSGKNGRVKNLILKYPNIFKVSEGEVSAIFDDIESLVENTNIRIV